MLVQEFQHNVTVPTDPQSGHLELVCGEARLVLTSDGGIFLNGKHLELQGVDSINGDSKLISWNCGVSKNPPEASEQQDSPDPSDLIMY
ncbi:TPA: hypothetical protein ROI66_001374 [Citrobacter sedlakii]|nr:hypothetical protein [Citrobacter sedlakii]